MKKQSRNFIIAVLTLSIFIAFSSVLGEKGDENPTDGLPSSETSEQSSDTGKASESHDSKPDAAGSASESGSGSAPSVTESATHAEESASSEKASDNSEKDSSEKDSKSSEKESKSSDKESKSSEKETKSSDKESKSSEKSSKTSEKESKSSEKKSDSSEKESKSSDSDSEKKTEKESKPTDKNAFPAPRAEAAIVTDANSGDVIYAMEADKRLFPAGTSNIMTAIIALENAKLGDSFTVTAEALANVKYDQPQLGMKEGETYTLEQLLYAILLNSDNDAANTIAIGIAGSIDAFVGKMNEKAAELELSGTHFANPTGWQDENHYTTAADLAVMARYAMRLSDFREIVKTPKYDLSTPHGNETLLSTNHLVSRYKYPYHYYSGAIGIKSGNSKDAGYFLDAEAEKIDLNVITVVLGCKNDDAKDGAYSFTDTAKMLNYIFENYKSVPLAKRGDIVYDSKVSEAKDSTRVAMTVDNDVYITLKNTADVDAITSEVKIIQDLKAPIHQGDYFGTITYFYNGKEIKTANVVAANEVKRDFMLHIFASIFHFIFNPIVFTIIVLAAAFWLRLNYMRNRKRRIRRKNLASQNKVRPSGGKSARTTSRTPSTRSRSFDRYHK